jgi:hypothetical protein
MMMDGRFDQHFAELFSASRAGQGVEDKPQVPLWPLALACLTGLALLALAALGAA